MSEVDETRTKSDPPPALVESGERRSIKTDLLQFEAVATFARVDFWCFVELMFPVLYPGQELVYAGYLELIATLLMRVGQRKYRNVVINLPPRHMKSALAFDPLSSLAAWLRSDRQVYLHLLWRRSGA